ncbi:SPASM domain-containing protein [Phosphitispora sp. TUW77]|uniref:SPASM domain-containing protein n=1 Tax=Phosphitispora sp. TUW77 TaxID=3152361 RepID=UPI003AB31D7C
MTKRKRYFRLFPEVIYVPGVVGSALYLLLQQKVFALDLLRSQILAYTEQNYSLEQAANQIGLSLPETEKFLDALNNLGAGCFLEQPCFVEKIRPFNPVEDITFFRPAPKINILHINLTSQCSQDCIFCEPGKFTPRLQPCLGCRRELAGREQILPFHYIKKALEETALLGCHSIVFHAGDPHITEELLSDTILNACKLNYNMFELITGTPLAKGLIKQLTKMKITPVFQIFSDQEAVHDHISGKKGNWAQLMQNIFFLKKNDYPFKLVYLFAGEDPDPYRVLANLNKLGPEAVYSDRLLKNSPPVKDFIYGENYLTPPDIGRYISKQKNHTCLHGKLALNWDGKYYPCPAFLGHELGHVRETTVQEIFAEKKNLQYWQSNNEQETCFKCEFRFACHRCEALFLQCEDKTLICGNNAMLIANRA